MQSNFLGTGLHKQKRIDVEVNLLEGWISSRGQIVREFQVLMLMFCASLCALLILLQPVLAIRSSAKEALTKVDTQMKMVSSQISVLKASADRVKPEVKRAALVSERGTYQMEFLNSIKSLANAAGSNVVLHRVQFDVLGGISNAHGRANGVNTDSSRAFINELSRTGSRANQLVVRPSSSFFEKGVEFDFEQKTPLEAR